jgi:nucleoside-diphosphate-sugar epimerase
VKVLVIGATGYIGSAVADALLERDHQVLGLARSERSAATLTDRRIEPVVGDFGDPPALGAVVAAAEVDVVVSAASLGAAAGDNATTFARDRDAVRAVRAVLGPGQALVFTSGSAVFGVFNGGEATDVVYDEDSPVPLPALTFAPASAGVHPLLAAGFGDSMAARVETEQEVLQHPDIRGIVIRPGLVYGHGGSYDVPALIRRARERGRAGHLGSGGTIQSFVQIDDLAELYCLAVERAPQGATLHGVTADVSQRELARAVNRMLGAGEHTDSLTLVQMLGMNAGERLGLKLTSRLPANVSRGLGELLKPPASVGFGISLSLDKRLSSAKTQRLLEWSPAGEDILEDIEAGSYATQPSRAPEPT